MKKSRYYERLVQKEDRLLERLDSISKQKDFFENKVAELKRQFQDVGGEWVAVHTELVALEKAKEQTMSEMKLCKDCGHFNDRNGECDVARLDPVTGDSQKLDAIVSRRWYCGLDSPVDFKAKEQPKPKEPEHNGCPFCGSDVENWDGKFWCTQCQALMCLPGITEQDQWKQFYRRAENRLPEIGKCSCGSKGELQPEGSMFRVRCGNCGAEGWPGATKRGAIENWNS